MAHAQADSSAPATLATVGVIAQDRGEATGAPASIEVLDAAAIANAQLRDIDQLSDQIANLRIAGEGSRASPAFVSLRGFVNPFGAPNSAVALIIDDVPVRDFYSFDSRLFDIDRIAVHKGPQGALYGVNSESGVIEIVTRKPDANARAFGEASLASRDGYAAGAGLSGALGNNVYASLAAARDGDEGYLDNLVGRKPYNGTCSANLRGRLVWNPFERVEVDAMLLRQRSGDHGGETYLPVDLASFNAVPTLGGLKLGRFDQALDHEGDSHARSTLAALKGLWHGEEVQLRAIASYRSHDARNSNDYDLSPQPWLVMDAAYRVRERYVELRAQPTDINAPVSWLAGVSADRRDIGFLRIADLGIGNTLQLPPGRYTRANETLNDRDVALFGRATWRFGTARNVGVSLGARVERVRGDMDFLGNALDPQPVSAVRSDARFLPTLSLDYRLAPAQLAYFSVTRGWQPGGYNTTAYASDHAQYRPETTTAFELGLKGELADGTASYALAAFRNAIRDYQDLVYSSTQLESNIVNAHRVRTQGVEAQSMLRPAANWQLGATFGSVQAVYLDAALGAAGLRLGGHALGQVPRFNYNLHAQYTQGAWLARMELAGASSFQVHDVDETTNRLREQRMPGYATLNARLGWRGTHWSAWVYGQNLTDRRYFTSATFGFALAALYPDAVGTVAPPRTLGIGVRWER